jgi:hypothetical protein
MAHPMAMVDIDGLHALAQPGWFRFGGSSLVLFAC